jgi:transcriptional regulator with XRE-family HTH domain
MEQKNVRRRLKAELLLQNKSRKVLAEKLEIKPRTLNNKLNGISDFTAKEIEILKAELGIAASEVYDIFIA